MPPPLNRVRLKGGGEKKNWRRKISGGFFVGVRKEFSDSSFKPYERR
jgi:hypothetical protein